VKPWKQKGEWKMGKQIETHDVRVSDALLAMARENGWQTADRTLHCPFLVIYEEDRRVGWNDKAFGGLELIGLGEAVRILRCPPRKEIAVGLRRIFITDTGIRIGCVDIPAEKVDEVHKAMHERMKAAKAAGETR